MIGLHYLLRSCRCGAPLYKLVPIAGGKNIKPQRPLTSVVHELINISLLKSDGQVFIGTLYNEMYFKQALKQENLVADSFYLTGIFQMCQADSQEITTETRD